LARSRGIVPGSRWRSRIITAAATRSPEERIVEGRVHAAAARSKARAHGASERIIRTESRGIQISFPDIVWIPSSPKPRLIPSWWAIDLVLILKPRRGKVARRIGSTRSGCQRVIERVWTGGLGKRVITQWITSSSLFLRLLSLHLLPCRVVTFLV
jgi:hypothetical protein